MALLFGDRPPLSNRVGSGRFYDGRDRRKTVFVYQIGVRLEATGNSKIRAKPKSREGDRGGKVTWAWGRKRIKAKG